MRTSTTAFYEDTKIKYCNRMTIEEKTEVRNYLIAKKLPVDLLMEVEDHFVSQINHLQSEKNLSFNDAFNAAIISWHDDLKLKWDGNFSLEDTSDFIKKSANIKIYPVFKQAVWVAFATSGFIWMASVIIPFYIFHVLFCLFIISLVTIPILIFWQNRKLYKDLGRFQTLPISPYQSLGRLFFFPVSFLWTFSLGLEIDSGFMSSLSSKDIAAKVILFLFIYFEVIVIVFQQKYIKTMRNVYPYIQENF